MSGIRDVWFFANNIIRTSRLLLNDALGPLNLSSAEGNILLELTVHGDGVRQDTIVEQLDISKSAVSRALDSLESKGHVLRERHPSDRRASMVFLTDRAQEMGPELEKVYQDLFAAASQGVSDREIAQFTELFRRVSGNLTRARHKIQAPGKGQVDVD